MNDPIIIDGVNHYTLTSYEPVSVTISATSVGEDYIDGAVGAAVSSKGGSLKNLFDNKWIQSNFPEVKDFNELRAFIGQQLTTANDKYYEQQKASACATALAERLEQRIPQNETQLMRFKVQQSFVAWLDKNNVSPVDYLKKSGKTAEDIDTWMDQQAEVYARQRAALSAYAEHHNITVNDDEFAEIMGVSEDEARAVLSEASARGQLENLRRDAAVAKAQRLLVEQSDCVFDYSNDDGIPGFVNAPIIPV